MNTDDYVFMPASLDDVDILSSLEQKLFHTDQCSKRSFRYLIRKAVVIVVRHRRDNSIYGYATLLTRRNSRKMRIYSLGIVESARASGIATRLVRYIENLARSRNCNVLTLEVHDLNLAGLALYQKAGFTQAGFKFEYYEDGGHAILMRKNISPATTFHHDSPLHESCSYQ